MGTSKSNIGPGNFTPLLPPWAPLPELESETGNEEAPLQTKNPSTDTEDSNQENVAGSVFSPNTGNWTSARRKLSSYANNPNTRNLKRAAREYVKVSGGGGNAAKSAISGKRVATRFGTFINDVRSKGIQEALSNLGLTQYAGESTEFILAKVADMLAPPGGLSEESIARSALLETLGTICLKLDTDSQDVSLLEKLDAENMALVIIDYISNYIYQRWLQELGFTIEKKDVSESFLIKTEKEAKKLIYNSLKVETKAINLLKTNFSKGSGKRIIDNVFSQAYILIETL